MLLTEEKVKEKWWKQRTANDDVEKPHMPNPNPKRTAWIECMNSFTHVQFDVRCNWCVPRLLRNHNSDTWPVDNGMTTMAKMCRQSPTAFIPFHSLQQTIYFGRKMCPTLECLQQSSVHFILLRCIKYFVAQVWQSSSKHTNTHYTYYFSSISLVFLARQRSNEWASWLSNGKCDSRSLVIVYGINALVMHATRLQAILSNHNFKMATINVNLGWEQTAAYSGPGRCHNKNNFLNCGAHNVQMTQKNIFGHPHKRVPAFVIHLRIDVKLSNLRAKVISPYFNLQTSLNGPVELVFNR